MVYNGFSSSEYFTTENPEIILTALLISITENKSSLPLTLNYTPRGRSRGGVRTAGPRLPVGAGPPIMFWGRNLDLENFRDW